MEETNDKFSQVHVTKQTPEDEFVPLENIRPYAPFRATRGRKFKGYGTRASFGSEDPRVHKAFVNALSGFMIIVALIFLLSGSILFPLLFIGAVLWIRSFMLRPIEDRAREMNVDMSPPEVQKAGKETVQEIKHVGNQVCKDTFTEAHIRDFKKPAFLFYTVLSLILVIGLSFLSIWLGLAVLIIVIITGVIYNAFLNFLVKKFQK